MSEEQKFRVDSEHSKAEFLQMASELYDEHKHVIFTWNTGKQRTLAQNAALHLWLGWVAKILNDAGFDMMKVLKHDAEIPWTMVGAKDNLWKPIQEAMLKKGSTKDAERDEYNMVCEALTRHLSQKLGVTLPPWPKKKDN